MKLKTFFAILIGFFQILIGVSTVILAYLIYYNPALLPIRTIYGLLLEHISFYIIILLVVGFIAIASGLLIIYEWT
jgi:hypothetical protein